MNSGVVCETTSQLDRPGARFQKYFIVQPDAAAAPVVGFDKRVKLHELVDYFL